MFDVSAEMAMFDLSARAGEDGQTPAEENEDENESEQDNEVEKKETETENESEEYEGDIEKDE